MSAMLYNIPFKSTIIQRKMLPYLTIRTYIKLKYLYPHKHNLRILKTPFIKHKHGSIKGSLKQNIKTQTSIIHS